MRLDRPRNEAAARTRFHAELRRLLDQPGPTAARPCPACDAPCPCMGSRDCACACTPDCPDAPRRMSSDPERFPVEAGIAPLVFALYATRVCRPCWSCEGHLDAAGRLRRPPAVWFYAETATYARMVFVALEAMRFERRIASRWRVGVTAVEHDNPCTLYTVEPAMTEDAPPSLDALQEDAAAIGAGLLAKLREQSRLALGAACVATPHCP